MLKCTQCNEWVTDGGEFHYECAEKAFKERDNLKIELEASVQNRQQLVMLASDAARMRDTAEEDKAAAILKADLKIARLAEALEKIKYWSGNHTITTGSLKGTGGFDDIYDTAKKAIEEA